MVLNIKHWKNGLLGKVIDANSLKIQGRGQLRFLPKYPGCQVFPDKIVKECLLFGVLLHFYAQTF